MLQVIKSWGRVSKYNFRVFLERLFTEKMLYL